jgi:hypothetical protein
LRIEESVLHARSFKRLFVPAQGAVRDNELVDLAGLLVGLRHTYVAVVELDRALVLHAPFATRIWTTSYATS